MNTKQLVRLAGKWGLAGIGVGAASYVAYAVGAWLRYGKPKHASGAQADPLLDLFFPRYEIVDRHQIVIDAPADVRGSVHAMLAGVVATTPTALRPGRHHVVAIRESERATIVVDGHVAASAVGPLPRSLRNDGALEVGRGPSGPFAAGVEGFEAFDRALTSAEVARLGEGRGG